MCDLLILLQNAYGVEEGYIPSYSRQSFIESHTGKRLKEAIPENIKVQIINSSPKIGNNADSIFPPDLDYVAEKIKNLSPKVILACGQVAKRTIKQLNLDLPTIFMPHPAYRALSKKTTSKAKEKLLRALSSVEEHGAHNSGAIGSNPIVPT